MGCGVQGAKNKKQNLAGAVQNVFMGRGLESNKKIESKNQLQENKNLDSNCTPSSVTYTDSKDSKSIPAQPPLDIVDSKNFAQNSNLDSIRTYAPAPHPQGENLDSKNKPTPLDPARVVNPAPHPDSKNTQSYRPPTALLDDNRPAHPNTAKSKTPQITFTLLSHATLLIKYNNFKLLCDPWLKGYAFLGAWQHFPLPCFENDDKNVYKNLSEAEIDAKIKAIAPDCILITHEHSDHFHPATLQNFDPTTPIFIPAFANERMQKRLANLGFHNIHIIHFGQPCEITKGFNLRFFEPVSLWNDSITLLEIEGFKILNINDAGINFKLLDEIGYVDVIAALFSPGASGYPATWGHISQSQKCEIFKNYKSGIINMLKNVCEKFSAKYLLPFASHFTLHHKSHLKYLDIVAKNSIFDMQEAFLDSKTRLIDIMHGESFNVATQEFTRKNYSQNELLDVKLFLRDLDSIADSKGVNFEDYYPNAEKYNASFEEIRAYFLNLNNVPEMIFCEDMAVEVETFSSLGWGCGGNHLGGVKGQQTARVGCGVQGAKNKKQNLAGGVQNIFMERGLESNKKIESKNELQENKDLDSNRTYAPAPHPQGENLDSKNKPYPLDPIRKVSSAPHPQGLPLDPTQPPLKVSPAPHTKCKITFEIKNGVLKILESMKDLKPDSKKQKSQNASKTPPKINLKIKLPHEILSFIVRENESWDEATIGYWCEFYREPDIYHANFFRILQTPFYLKNPRLSQNPLSENNDEKIPAKTPQKFFSKMPKITLDSNVADILESNELATAILSRYGLYCKACNYAPQESLKNACEKHAINPANMERLVMELNRYVL